MAPQVNKKVAGLSAAAATLVIVFIPRWEGMDTTVRHFSFDPPGVYTVCNGITNLDPDYAHIRPGMKFSEAQCAEAFAKVLPKYVAPIAECIPSFASMPPHRQVALASASYNLGPQTICRSTAARLLNQGKVKEGCEALGAFVRANGVVLKGLQNRRFDPKWGEIAWCKRDD